ncbi:MAG: hypothetical protein AB8I08_40550 [Sandaracinaceae bacterium]
MRAGSIAVLLSALLVALQACGVADAPESATSEPSPIERSDPASSDTPPAPADLDEWSYRLYDAGEPTSVWLPVTHPDDVLQNGFGYLTVDEHVVWLNYQHRERVEVLRPPISLHVTSEELCGAAGAEMRGWGAEPYAIEFHDEFDEVGLQCLRGLSPRYIYARWADCDALVDNDLLPTGLHGLTVAGCSDASLRAIARLPHLEMLALGDPITDARLAILANAASLTWVSLHARRGVTTSLQGLSALNVRALLLSGRREPTAEDIEAIASMPELRELSLALSSVRMDQPHTAWRFPRRLERLELSRADPDTFAAACALPSLRSLSIDRAEGVEDIQCLGRQSELETLRVMVPVSDADITAIGTLSRLRDLFIIVDERVDLGPLRNLRSLRALRLAGQGVRSRDMETLAVLSGLRTLWLQDTRVTHLRSLVALRQLHRLIMQGRPPMRLGMSPSAVADLTRMRALREVSLPALDEASRDRLREARPEVLVW